ncbi:acyl-CoA thioesterase [Bacteroidales bacterium OttesenSCG-928-I21]|nr:acyl-CoA thioesterase [Bacteroidales bacterium OttesenSCG-928-I21]
MIVQEYKHRVLYADTDAMGVMYYANYLRVYEAARADFLDKINLPLSDMEKTGVICPVINVNADYLRSAKYDWVVKVITKVEKAPAAKLIVQHEMYSPDGVLLNKAQITLGFVDRYEFKAIRCPDWIREGFEKNIENK